MCSVNPITLSLVVNGRRVPRIETALRLARALSRTQAELGLPDLPAELTGGEQ